MLRVKGVKVKGFKVKGGGACGTQGVLSLRGFKGRCPLKIPKVKFKGGFWFSNLLRFRGGGRGVSLRCFSRFI